MRLWLCACLTVALLPGAGPNQLTDEERRAGWLLLFDGQTTTGWREITGKPFPSDCWTIEDGSLVALVRAGGFQDIRTEAVFRSFDFQFEWKTGVDGNSGVKYRIQKVDEWTNAAGRQARARGLEYQLAGERNPDAASDPRRFAGSLYSLIAPTPRVVPRFDQFNQSRLLVRGRRVEHWLNGSKVVEFDLDQPEVRKLLNTASPLDECPISLQNHSSKTWFRNLKIRRLD